MSKSKTLSPCCLAEIMPVEVKAASMKSPREIDEICGNCGQFVDEEIQVGTCPGCSGSLSIYSKDPAVFVCDDCGGLITVQDAPLPIEKVGEFVHLGCWGKDPEDSEDLIYFDFFLDYAHGSPPDQEDVRRVHGWFNSVTKYVVQFG